MAVLNVVYYPDDPLMKKAEPVTKFGPKLERLAADMFETVTAYEGLGLAAPQVGVSKRIVVVREPEGPEVVLVNHEIVEREGSEMGEEGCLSLPHMYAMVPRATRIRVKAQDVHGEPLDFEATDFFARIIQHEGDHLDGVLFPDRLDIITRQAILEEWAEVRERLLAAPDEAEAEHVT